MRYWTKLHEILSWLHLINFSTKKPALKKSMRNIIDNNKNSRKQLLPQLINTWHLTTLLLCFPPRTIIYIFLYPKISNDNTITRELIFAAISFKLLLWRQKFKQCNYTKKYIIKQYKEEKMKIKKQFLVFSVYGHDTKQLEFRGNYRWNL